jgi:hypothetical protein
MATPGYLDALIGHLGIDDRVFYDTLTEVCLRNSVPTENGLQLMGKEIDGTWTADNIKALTEDHYARSRAEKRCWFEERSSTSLDQVITPYPNIVNKTDVCSLDTPLTWLLKSPPSNYIMDRQFMSRFVTSYSLYESNNFTSVEMPLSLDIYTSEPQSPPGRSQLQIELNSLSCEIDKLRVKSQQTQHINPDAFHRSKYFQQDVQPIDQLRVCSRYEWPPYFVKGRTAIWKQLLKAQVLKWELSALADLFQRLVAKGFVQGADGDNNNPDAMTTEKVWDVNAEGNDLRNEVIKQYHSQLIKEIVREQAFLIDDMEEVTIPLTYEEVHYYTVEYMDLVLLYWNQRANRGTLPGEDLLQSLNRVNVLKRVLDLARPVDAMSWYEEWKLKQIAIGGELPDDRFVRQFISGPFEQYRTQGEDEANRVILNRDEDVLCAYRYILYAKEIQLYYNLTTSDYMRERTETLLINVVLANIVDEDYYNDNIKSGTFAQLRTSLNAAAYSAIGSLIAFAHPILWRHMDEILLNRDRLNEKTVASLNSRSDFKSAPYDVGVLNGAREKIDTIVQEFKDKWGDIIADPSTFSGLLDRLRKSPMGIVLKSNRTEYVEGQMDRYRINLGLSRGDTQTTLCGEYMSNIYNNAPSMRSQQDSALYDMEVLQKSFGRLVLSQQYIEERERRNMSRSLRFNRRDSRLRFIKIVTEVDTSKFPLKDADRISYTCVWKVKSPRTSKTDIEQELNIPSQIVVDDESKIKRFVLDMPISTDTLGTVEIEGQVKATYVNTNDEGEVVHSPITSLVSAGIVTVEICGTCSRCSKEYTTPSSHPDLVRGEAVGSEAVDSDWKERVCEWQVPLYMIEQYKAKVEGRSPTFDHIKRDAYVTYRGRHSDYSMLPDLYGLSVGHSIVHLDSALIRTLDNAVIGRMRMIRGSERLYSFFNVTGFDAEIRRLLSALNQAVVGQDPAGKDGQSERLDLVNYIKNINSHIILSGTTNTAI